MRDLLLNWRPERDVVLHPNETIIHIMHRHLVHLMLQLLIPALLLLLSGGVALYRGIGGQFFVSDAAIGGEVVAFDQALGVGFALLLISAWVLRRRIGASLGMIVLSVLAAALLLFRVRGGRVLSIDPFATQQALDLPNIALGSVALVALLICIYLYLDWKTDEFILTNHRVIFNRELPLVRRNQEQLPLANIQQVESSTETYLQHWLKLGTLKIKSAAVGFSIYFEAAYDPEDMQRIIMDQVKKVRREESDADLRHMVEATVAGQPFERAQREVAVERTVAPGVLQWLFPINPKIDRDRDIYTWHRHWFFLIRVLILPFTLWLIMVGVVVGAMATGPVAAPLLGLGLIIATLAFAGWTAWQIEDHRNDRYILTPTQVIDIAKRPLGPESRRTASLDALQNVTYKTTLFGRIFGYGDVLLQTAGASEDFTFYDAPRPSQMVDLITSYQVAHKRSARLRNLAETVKLIQYYDAHLRHEENEAPEPLAREVGGA
jgi:uncharacterized membrane protein YdbT with pleckstrin-like domain